MVGITSTVPVEAIYAAGLRPVDLNNRFVADPDRERLVARAEARGFPVNLCSWIKGNYSVVAELKLRRVVGVVRGDCSSTEKLMEVWRHEGRETIPFAYPTRPDPLRMKEALEAFAQQLGTTLEAAEKMRHELAPIRAMLAELDQLTWQDGRVTGFENHLWLVSASDFTSELDCFAAELEAFLNAARTRPARPGLIRLGYLGVPPIVDGLYDFLEARGAQVTFNEVQRQFAMLGDHADLAAQYTAYTYPYDTFNRLDDVLWEARRRNLQGLIHYAQTFCHRQIEAIILRERLDLPILTLEADRPGPLDPRSQTRIEAFLEQLR